MSCWGVIKCAPHLQSLVTCQSPFSHHWVLHPTWLPLLHKRPSFISSSTPPCFPLLVPKWEQQGDPTGVWRSEKEVNTDEAWESQMAAVEEYSSSLARQHSNLLKEQEEEEAENEKHKEDLEKKKEEAACQHKVWTDEMYTHSTGITSH